MSKSISLFKLIDAFDLLYILTTYLLYNDLIRQKKHKGGGEFENRSFNCKYNHKVEFWLNTWCFLWVWAIILHLALCWKHDLKKPFLRQLLNQMISAKNPNPKMSILTPKTKVVSYLDMIWYSLTHSDVFWYTFWYLFA